MSISPAECMPEDADRAVLVGRTWVPGAVAGPSPIRVRDGRVFDLARRFPTLSELLEARDPVAASAPGADTPEIGAVDDILRNSATATGNAAKRRLLAPADLQAIKASGVTFAASLLERLIEEHARGDFGRAEEIRAQIQATLGDAVAAVRPGSPEAMRLRASLMQQGLWSQYLEVGLGEDAEIFTKCQPLSAVGFGADIGILARSSWNNPEPEIVLAVDSRQRIVGATLGNDVNLRDFEGRSALLLGRAKDNNASTAIGPFIRLLDAHFTLDDVRQAEVSLTVEGADGYRLAGGSSIAKISRDPAELVRHAAGAEHQYPDGFLLFLGTMFAPIADRGEKGCGFTHKLGDIVTVSTPRLGRLVNRVDHCERIAPWTFGIAALMRNLSARGLLRGQG
jgi:fumarylacetoacetate (FAA) hydrolase family protein